MYHERRRFAYTADEPMSFDEVWGQEPAIQTLTRALQSGKVHHAYRFEGPAGVGKQMAALRFARALVCERGGLGCGECSACRRALTLSEESPRVPQHPDIVLLGRGLYKDVITQGEATGISIEQVRRVVLSRIGFPPHEGRALVFIVRDAEELTLSAVNALLKTLEEPPARTFFVLLSSRPNRLLDTIRSRTLPVRFAPLSDEIIARILAARGLPTDAASYAQGSADAALGLADPELFKEQEQFTQAIRQALAAVDLAPALKFAESYKADRDALKEQLGFLAQSFAAEARKLIADAPAAAQLCAAQHQEVLVAVNELERNVSNALVLETLVQRLRRVAA